MARGGPQRRRGEGGSDRPIASLVRKTGSSGKDDFRRDEKDLEPPCSCSEPAFYVFTYRK